MVANDHLAQATHNEDFAKGLVAIKAPFCDWGITACFYAALHYMYYNLTPDSIFGSHHDFEEEISKKYNEKSKVWILYKKLQNSSKNARYYPQIGKLMTNDKQQLEKTITLLQDLKKELGINNSTV